MKTVKDGFLDKINTIYDKVKAVHDIDGSDEILEARLIVIQDTINKQTDEDKVLEMMMETLAISYIVTKEVV